MEVCFLASGERVAGFDAHEFEGKSTKTLKQTLAARIGISRFRQRLFLEGDSREIPDDEVFTSVPAKVQLVVLDFLPPDAGQDEAMITASREGDLHALNQLLQCRRNPNVEDERGRTPLSIAAEEGHLEIAKLLLEAAPDQATPVRVAAERDHIDVARLLLEASYGSTPLLVAAQRGHFDIARLLLEAGHLAPNECANALIRAAELHNRKLTRVLLEARADPDQEGTGRPGAGSCTTALFRAAELGHIKILCLLLEAGAAPNQARRDGATPLLAAAQLGHADIARLLLEAGAAPDQARADGATPLLVAAEGGHVDVARLLLGFGAAPDLARKDGTTPLVIAARKDCFNIASLLIEAGAAPGQARKDGA